MDAETIEEYRAAAVAETDAAVEAADAAPYEPIDTLGEHVTLEAGTEVAR